MAKAQTGYEGAVYDPTKDPLITGPVRYNSQRTPPTEGGGEPGGSPGQGGPVTGPLPQPPFPVPKAPPNNPYPPLPPANPNAGTGIFTKTSTYQNLINTLNSNKLDPTHPLFKNTVNDYLKAIGLTGNAPNGMPYGAYDDQRQKIYLPGYDIRFENGSWVAHPWGAGSGGGGGTDTASMMDALMQSFGPNAAERAALHTRIGGLLDKYSTDPSASDPIIANQTQAYQGQTARALQDAEAQMAERAHQTGISSGAYDSQLQNATLAQGRDVGGFQSKLISDELTNRRSALANTLNTYAGILSDEDKNQLTARIAAIDEALKSRGLDLQNQQFYDELARLLALDAQNSDTSAARGA